jgi:hypothetical protein
VNTVRETVFGTVYFGVYEYAKSVLKEQLPNVLPGSYSSLLAIQLAGIIPESLLFSLPWFC